MITIVAICRLFSGGRCEKIHTQVAVKPESIYLITTKRYNYSKIALSHFK
jgi:hypothetical protein